MTSKNELFENAQVVYRNFQGRAGMFNSEGERSFCIILDPKRADELEAMGWNVKTQKPREEGDEEKRYIQVSVNYSKGRPPRVVMINSQGRVDLGADEVKILDFMPIVNWDIVINPYPWQVNENKGIKAYLNKAFVTIEEDAFDLKYADLPDLNPTTSPSNTTASEEVGV
jgi:hypothetical protein